MFQRLGGSDLARATRPILGVSLPASSGQDPLEPFHPIAPIPKPMHEISKAKNKNFDVTNFAAIKTSDPTGGEPPTSVTICYPRVICPSPKAAGSAKAMVRLACPDASEAA
jgi:hypothetical protein